MKNNGYHMEHNFGHGTDGLSNLLLTMNLIAFGFHTVCDQICELWRHARERISTRFRFFNTLSVLNDYHYYTGWHDLLDNIIHPRRPRAPP